MGAWLNRRLLLITPWIILFLSEIFLCNQYILQVSVSPLSSSLNHSLHIDSLSLATVAASFYYSAIFFTVIGGVLLDKYGLKKTLALSSLSSTVGAFLFCYSDDTTALVIARLLMGVGAGFSFIGAIKVARSWFNDKMFALINGATLSIGTVGSMIGTTVLAHLLQRFFWRELLFYLSVFSLLITVLILVIVDDPPNVKKNKKISIKYFFRQKVKPVLGLKQLWLHGFFNSFFTIIFFTFCTLWCIPFFEKLYHTRNAFTEFSPSFIFIGYAIGCMFFAYLSSLCRSRPVLIRVISMAFLVFSSFVFYLNLSEFYMGICLLMTGFLFGIIPVIFINISAHLESDVIATGVSIVRALTFLMSGLLLPFLGWMLQVDIHDKAGRHLAHLTVSEYRSVFYVITLGVVISIFISFFICSPQKSK